jgi:uncharacterized protein YbjT (DUF2867 family)
VAIDMLLVVGGTGELGGRIVERLRDRDIETRCLVRPTSSAEVLDELGASVVRGDLTNPASLTAACQGVETVVASATVIRRRLWGSRRPTIREVDEEGMAALIDAAESAGVRRFVYLSYAGVDAGLGTPLEHAKLATEQRLRRSAMRTVVIRPDAFQEIHLAPVGRFDMAAGKVAVFGRGDMRRRWVSTDDVAALVERLVGHKIKVQRMPRLVARLGIRLLNRRNDALASIFGTGLLQDVEGTWDDGPLRERGIVPRPASDFLREQARNLS